MVRKVPVLLGRPFGKFLRHWKLLYHPPSLAVIRTGDNKHGNVSTRISLRRLPGLSMSVGPLQQCLPSSGYRPLPAPLHLRSSRRAPLRLHEQMRLLVLPVCDCSSSMYIRTCPALECARCTCAGSLPEGWPLPGTQGAWRVALRATGRLAAPHLLWDECTFMNSKLVLH